MIRGPLRYTALPMFFMLAMTLWALAQLLGRYGPLSLIGGIAGVLFVLAVLIVAQAAWVLRRPASEAKEFRLGFPHNIGQNVADGNDLPHA